MSWCNFQAGYRCTVCRDRERNSIGERAIEKYLTENNITFKQHFTGFKDCKHTNVLEFDFYVPDMNLIIEYDGEQHFRGWSGIEDNKLLQQKRDKIKHDYALLHNIDILHIPYTETENINDILNMYIENKNILSKNVVLNDKIYNELYNYLR